MKHAIAMDTFSQATTADKSFVWDKYTTFVANTNNHATKM
jgi:hypothetical protein